MKGGESLFLKTSRYALIGPKTTLKVLHNAVDLSSRASFKEPSVAPSFQSA